jgi:signal transduction histidine kinase
MHMHEMNRKILQLAQKGLPRETFLESISVELINYAGCDALELRLADEHLQYVWHSDLDRSARYIETRFQKSAEGSLIPCLSNGSSEEQVCNELFRQRYNPELNYHYHTPSILITDAWHDQRFLDADGVSLGERTGFSSLFYLSFATNEDVPGLLIFKKKDKYMINRDEVASYENLAQTLGIAIAFRRSQYALGERVKELTCLHSISKLLHDVELEMDETFQKLVMMIPESFQFPAKTGCYIKIGDHVYQSLDYQAGKKKLQSKIFSGRELVGEVIVCLLDSELEFISEEYDLLNSIAGATGAIYRKLQSEEEKQEIEERLRQADRLATIGQLAAGIAHELNEPLSNILGYAQLVSADLQSGSSMGSDLEKIISSSLHAREIVRKLLLFARQMPLQRSQVNINEIINESLQIVGSRIHKHSINLKLDLAKELPEITADSSQLKQVIINLLVNAEQAMPAGGLLEISTRTDSRKRIRIKINDSGIGMNRNTQKKIFLPFFTTKELGEGTGLGLAVVHGIVKAHGGSIKVRSIIDEGTTIILNFPINYTKGQNHA